MRTPDPAQDRQVIGWTGQRRWVSAEAVARDRCACPTHHRPFRDVLAKRRPQGQMFRSTVEIVVALWCDERSSLPLQSRPISAWFYLSATAASTTYSGEVNATQIPSPVQLNRKPTASRSPSATPRHARPAQTSCSRRHRLWPAQAGQGDHEGNRCRSSVASRRSE